MADPVSVTAGLISLAEAARNILHVIGSTKIASLNHIETFELNVSLDLLAEIRGYPLSDEAMPKAVLSCLTFCHEQVQRLELSILHSRESKATKVKAFGSKEAGKEIKGFTKAVKMLREIVMEYESHLKVFKRDLD